MQFLLHSSSIRDKFHPAITTGSPERGASNKGELNKTSYILYLYGIWVNIAKKTVEEISKVTIND